MPGLGGITYTKLLLQILRVHFRHQGYVTDHAMSKGEVAEGSLTPEEEDGSVRPSKQSVPGQAALGGLSNWVKTLKFSKILLGIPR